MLLDVAQFFAVADEMFTQRRVVVFEQITACLLSVASQQLRTT